jgi:hypothetical protein
MQARGQFIAIKNNGGGKADLRLPLIVSIHVKVNPKLLAHGYIWSSEDPDPDFVSSNCTLFPCVRSVKSPYQLASVSTILSYREETVKEWMFETDTTYKMTSPIAPEFGMQSGQVFGFEDGRAGLLNFISATFDGFYRTTAIYEQTYSRNYQEQQSDAVYAIWNGNYTGCEHPQNPVSCAIELTAKAMSKTICDTPYIVTGTLGTVGKLIHLLFM